jgi:hypothetical protein
MTAVELATYQLPKDPVSPMPVRAYVACVALYEQGFSVPSHLFLRSSLQYYSIELHHLTPSRIMHITAFVTLCEAYIGIKPHFDLWNHFFRVRPMHRVRKWWFWVAWTSVSNLCRESIPTSTSPCPNLRTGGEK